MSTLTAPRNLWTVTKGEIVADPHPGQQRAMLSRARFVAMLAGTQGGKTALGPLWLYQEIRDKGPGDYLAVTASFPLLKLKMLPEFLRFFDTLGLGRWQASDKVYQFHREPTRVIFGTANKPESLESATAKGAWLDEAGQDQFRLESWEAIIRRLSIHRGRALLGTTLYNLGWLKSEVYDPWMRGDPDYECIQFESVENPSFPRDEYEAARRRLPGWKFDLFYRGRYAKPAGLIYSDFNDELVSVGGHLVEPFPIPPEWERWVGIDFGAVNTAMIWVAQDPETRAAYIYRESLEGGKSTPGHVSAALGHQEAVTGWYGGARGETQQRMDWTAAGIPVQEPRIADVEAGIDRVIEAFKLRRLFVFTTCKGLRDELGTYSRKVDERGEPLEAIRDKETFHRLDALRYVAPAIGRQSVRVLEVRMTTVTAGMRTKVF